MPRRGPSTSQLRSDGVTGAAALRRSQAMGMLEEPAMDELPVAAAPFQVAEAPERRGQGGGEAGEAGVAGKGRARGHRREKGSDGRGQENEDDDGVGVLARLGGEKRRRGWEEQELEEERAEEQKR